MQAEDEVQGLFSDICSPSSFDQADMVISYLPWPFFSTAISQNGSGSHGQSANPHAFRVPMPLTVVRGHVKMARALGCVSSASRPLCHAQMCGWHVPAYNLAVGVEFVPTASSGIV